VRFFVFDAKAGIPFFFFLAHVSYWTLAISIFSFVVFGVLDAFSAFRWSLRSGY